MNFLKNKFMLRTLFGAYILFLVVIMLANGILVGNVCRQMNDELKRVNDYYLRILKLNIDSLFSEADSAQRQITGDGEINAFSGYAGLDSRARFDAAAVVDKLSGIGADNRTASDCILYFPHSDIVITAQAFYNSEIYYNLYVAAAGQSYDEWLAGFADAGTRGLMHSPDGKIAITYGVRRAGDEQYYIRLMIDETEMFSPIYVERYAAGGGAVVILSKNGDMLISSDGRDYNFKNAMFEKEYEIKKYRPIDEKVFVYYVNSDRYDYRYVLVSENDYFTDSMQSIFLIGLAVSVLCLVCIGVILVFVNKKNSGRLESIMQELGDDETVYEGDEFSVIKQKIALSRKRKEAIEEKLEQQTYMLRNNVIVNFLLGYTDGRNIEEKFSDYQILPCYENWFALAICVFDYGILNDLQNADTMFVINNVMEDLTKNEDLLRVDIDGMLIYLVNVKTDAKSERQKYTEILDKIKRLMRENFQISFYSAISTVKKGITELAGAYREAASGIDSARFYDVESTVLYDEICESAELFDETAAQRERDIITAVRLGDMQRAADEIDALFDRRPDGARMAKWRYEAVVYNILSSISSQNSDPKLQQKLHAAADDLLKSGMPGMKQLLLSAVEAACENTKNEDKSNNEVYRRIKQYVEENYTNTELDVTRIGEQLGMAPFYLSRVFKNCSGEKLVGFINSLRIERAKVLLGEGKIAKVNDVALQCGYENVRTFLKVFKEKEGMTPTQYRKMHIK